MLETPRALAIFAIIDISQLAEGTGFEPVMPYGIFAFQANALDRYANPPNLFFLFYPP